MSWFVVFLGLILALAGGWGFYACIDLLTTQLGLLYAICGAVAVSGGLIVIAIGLLMRRVDALRRALAHTFETMPRERVEPLAPALPVAIEPALVDGMARQAPAVEFAEPAMAPALDEAGEHERAVNENRKGRSPSPDAPEPAAQEPAAPPSLVGRYSAGGANYSIYSDGSIEAETDQGAFKFGSMSEFKAFIAAKRN